MKKTLYVLLLVVMLVAMLAVPAMAEDTHAGHCVCGGTYDACAHTDLEGEWQPWDGGSNITAGGNYYLTQDITKGNQRWLGYYGDANGFTINLCLNGHSITSEWRVFAVGKNTTVNLMNCSDTQSVLTGCCNNGDSGRVIELNAGTVTLNMYGNIKLVGAETAGRVVLGGGAVRATGKFNMYGGEIVGGYVGGMTSTTKDGTTTYTAHAGQGGAVYINGSTGQFNLYDGVVYGGNGGTGSENKVTDGANGKYTHRSEGGVVYISGAGKFNMYGGTVYGSHVGDGAVFFSNNANAVTTISGGTIYAGFGQYSGGVAKLSGGSKVIMTGGVIDGNNPLRPDDTMNAGGAGGGAFLLWDGHAEITGDAVIKNCVTSNVGGAIKAATTISSVKIGGDVQIVGNGKGTKASNYSDNIYLNEYPDNDNNVNATLTIDGLTAKAKVGINAKNMGVVATGVSADAASAIYADSGVAVAYSADGTLSLTAHSAATHCVCGGKDAQCAGHANTEGGWTAWNGKTAIAESGNYYLTANVTQGQIWLGNADGVTPVTINLCLNGYSITSPNRVWGIRGATVVNIMNCSANESHLLGNSSEWNSKPAQGGTILIQGTGAINIYDNVHLGSVAEPAYGCSYGGVIAVEAAGVINMYGGRITGRTCTGFGGAVCLNGANGKFYLHDGEIYGGTAAGGGNIAVVGELAEFVMYGGKVYGGVSKGQHGGNIAARNDGSVTILGGIVENGIAQPADGAAETNQDAMDKNGGNLALVDNDGDTNKGTITIGGDAQILGGQGDRGGNIFVHSGTLVVKDQAKVTGGTAVNKGYGGGENCIQVNNTSTAGNTACYVSISGTPEITGILYKDAIDMSGLEKGAKIGVNRAGEGRISKAAVALDIAMGITSTDTNANRKLTREADGIYSRAASAHVHCICGLDENGQHYGGCDGYDINFATDWSGEGNQAGGVKNYFISSDLSKYQVWLGALNGGKDADGNEVVGTFNLCMNGHNRASSGRAFAIGTNGVVNITNCKTEGGQHIYSGETNAQGGAVLMQKGSTLNIYNNVHFVPNAASTKVNKNAGVLALDDAGTVNMYGGSLTGREVTADGGVIRMLNNSVFNMYGGVINGGTATTNGGAIVAYSSKIFIHGGTIQGGTAKNLGGNIYADTKSTVEITGGTITGGTALGAGNIGVAAGSSLTMTDGIITLGTANGENKHGGNLYVYADSSATITGGEISDGKVIGKLDSNGGNIAIADTNGKDPMASLTIAGDAQILGGQANRGANMFLHSGNIAIGGNAKITNGVAADLTEGAEGYEGVAGGVAHCVQINNTMSSFKGSVTLSGAPQIDSVYLRDQETLILDGLDANASIGLESNTMHVLVPAPLTEAEAACFFSADETKQLVLTDSGLVLCFASNAEVSVNGETMTFSEAVEAVAGTDDYITLIADIEDGIAVLDDVYVDLNGFDINGNVEILSGKQLKAFDSGNVGYTLAEDFGKITGAVTGTIARSINTPASLGHNYKIIAVKDAEDGWSFHRIYMTVKSVVLTPYDTGINYKTVLKCNDYVAAHLAANGYGVQLAGKDYSYNASVAAGGDANEKLVKVSGVLDAADMADLAAAQAKAETVVAASAWLKLSDGAVIRSSTTGRTLVDAIKVANEAFATLTAKQQNALVEMYNKYSALMAGWSDEIVGNIRGSAMENPLDGVVYHCYCEGTAASEIAETACAKAGHPQVAWYAWDRTTSVPSVSGNYYLTEDVNIWSGSAILTGDTMVALDLNGHNITCYAENDPSSKTDYNNIYNVQDNASLVLTDSVGGGVIVPGSDTYWETGLGMAVHTFGSNASFDMYAGIIDCTNVQSDYGVAINSYGPLNIYGGTITGGTANGSGGIVFSNNTFNMYGGTIENGVSAGTEEQNANRGGGNVRLGAKAVFHMYDGLISGGTAAHNGGNIRVDSGAKAYIHGGEIFGGTAASNGGSIYVAEGAEFYMDGGVINGGAATKDGGSIYATAPTAGKKSVISITNATLYGGTAANGGIIYADYNVNIDISDSTLYAGSAARGGGAIKVQWDLPLNISNTVIDGNNPYLAEDAVNSGNNGGGLFIEQSKATLTNVTIQNCTAAGMGGGLFVNNQSTGKSVVTLAGDTLITGNSVSNHSAYPVAGAGLCYYKAVSELNISGNVQIVENTYNGRVNNADLVEGAAITVSGELAEDSQIGITGLGVVVNGEYASESVDYFYCDDNALEIVDNGDDTLSVAAQFQVGYAVADINPTADGTVSGTLLEGIGLSGYSNDASRICTSVDQTYGLIASVLAVTGEDSETVLIISVDSAGGSDAIRKAASALITKKTGIPASNIAFNFNHQHSTPATYAAYTAVAAENISNAAVAAMADRAPAEMYNTSVYVNEDYANNAATAANAKFTYVRNYKLLDAEGNIVGMVTDNHEDTDREGFTYETMVNESDADDQVQLVKFVRDGASTIVMANFQTHPHMMSGGSTTVAHSDLIGVFRVEMTKALEADGTDYDVMYISGAGGNINPHGREFANGLGAVRPSIVLGSYALGVTRAKILPERVMAYISEEGYEWDELAVGEVETATAMNSYSVMLNEIPAWAAENGVTMEQFVAAAKEIYDGKSYIKEWDSSYLDTYGIYSKFHAKYIVIRENNTEEQTKDLTIGAVSMGDLAFALVPYEMFDTNGMEVKDNSPFSVTFVNTLAAMGNCTTSGHNGYIPSAMGYENGGYSTDIAQFAAGTGEAVVEDLMELLESLA